MRFLVISNPRSRRGGRGLENFRRRLERQGASVAVRAVPDGVPIAALVGDAAAFDQVVAAGGDGTVSAVASALRGSGVPVLAYPAGAANLVALNLGLPASPSELARIALAGESRACDLAVLDTGHETGFLVGAGAGFDADLIAGARDLKRVYGHAAYVIAALLRTRRTPARITLELDGGIVRTEGIAVMALNFGLINFGIAAAPGASPSDGLLDVLVLRAADTAGILAVVWARILRRLGAGRVDLGGRIEEYRAANLRVWAAPLLPLQFDGEILPPASPFVIKVLPGAARLVTTVAGLGRAGHPRGRAPAPGRPPG